MAGELERGDSGIARLVNYDEATKTVKTDFSKDTLYINLSLRLSSNNLQTDLLNALVSNAPAALYISKLTHYLSSFLFLHLYYGT